MNGQPHSNIKIWDCSYQPFVWVPGTTRDSILPLYQPTQAQKATVPPSQTYFKQEEVKAPSKCAATTPHSEQINEEEDPLDNV